MQRIPHLKACDCEKQAPESAECCAPMQYLTKSVASECSEGKLTGVSARPRPQVCCNARP